MKSIVLNPIIAKEFRLRMRSWKSPLLISIYLGILALIALACYWIRERNIFYSGFGPDVGPQIFVTLAIFQLLLISFVTPALTAAVINGERERQTFDLLICTPLSAVSIILNKLLASITYVLLLLISSLPVFGIVFLFGGVLFSDIVWLFLIYIMTALTFAVIGIFCSTIFKRTQLSMVVSYVMVFFFLLGIPLISIFIQQTHPQSYMSGSVPLVAYLNPVMALISLFPAQAPGMGILNSLMYTGGYPKHIGIYAGSKEILAPWQYNFIFDGAIIIILLIITIFLIDPVGRLSWLRRLRYKEESMPAESEAERLEL